MGPIKNGIKITSYPAPHLMRGDGRMGDLLDILVDYDRRLYNLSINDFVLSGVTTSRGGSEDLL